MSKTKFYFSIVAKLWQTRREDIIGLCVVARTIVAIYSLFLPMAEPQPQSQSGTGIKTEIQAEEKPQSETLVPTETQWR